MLLLLLLTLEGQDEGKDAKLKPCNITLTL
jgi:hypothetical protein